MHAFKILFTAGVFSSAALALPRTIAGRGDTEILAADCANGLEPFTAEALIVATDAAVDLIKNNKAVGVGNDKPKQVWPQKFSNKQQLHQLATGPLFEFPVLRSGEVYNGGAVDVERVVFTKDGVISSVVNANGNTETNFASCKLKMIPRK